MKVFQQNSKPLVVVVDGQGGGMGGTIIAKLRPAFGEKITILALGTNALATHNMLKAGAHAGASGENAILSNVPRADFILGPIGIIIANAMIGELTPAMAEAISSCRAQKLLLPVTTCNVEVLGVRRDAPLPGLIEEIIARLQQLLNS